MSMGLGFVFVQLLPVGPVAEPEQEHPWTQRGTCLDWYFAVFP